LVKPGIHRTPILEKFLASADQARVVDYGSAAEYATRVKCVFDAANSAPETPGPDEVVEAFVRLIETPGRRANVPDRADGCPAADSGSLQCGSL
jgi:hypothetical protein